MYNENRVKQVISAINSSTLQAMDDESLAKLLSMLTPVKLDVFESLAYQQLGGGAAMRRIFRIKPMVQVLVQKELYRIRTSDIYSYYLEALNTGRYAEFFKTLSVEELGDLKKYITFSVNTKDEVQKSAAEKIVKMLTREITAKDISRKPTLNNN